MKDFFKGVRRHIERLDAPHLREQYARVADELAFSEAILETMDEGYFVVENDTRSLVWSNPAAERLFAMALEDIIATLELPLGRAAKRSLAVTYPESRTLSVQTIPMESRTLVKVCDVTAERERTEEELRAGATRAVRDLASGVAHEIGNPLNAISLNLQLLEREHPGDVTIGDCRSQIARLDGILRGFLQALRPSKPNLMPSNAADPITACLKTLKAQFEERQIRVTVEIPSALPTVALDSAQMEQVYFNLLKNALEAMRDGGEIAITVDSDDNDVIVRIADSGDGMTNEQLAHLFEPYRTSKEHGTGLGLMVSSRIVRDHGGTIDVESSLGVGTTFIVRLPRLERRIRRLE